MTTTATEGQAMIRKNDDVSPVTTTEHCGTCHYGLSSAAHTDGTVEHPARPVPFSDAKLRQDIEDYESGKVTMPGSARQARHLLRVPQEHRMDVARLSTYIMNTSPGWRPSDSTGEAVRIFEREGIE